MKADKQSPLDKIIIPTCLAFANSFEIVNLVTFGVFQYSDLMSVFTRAPVYIVWANCLSSIAIEKKYKHNFPRTLLLYPQAGPKVSSINTFPLCVIP